MVATTQIRPDRQRWVDLQGLISYTSLKRSKAIELGKDSKSATKYGRRPLYDLDKVDAYLEQQAVYQ